MGNAPVRGVGASEPTTITKSDAEYMDEARRFVPGARRVPAMNTANLTWHRPDGFEIGLELGGGDDFAADEAVHELDGTVTEQPARFSTGVVQWRQGDLLGSGAFGRVYLGLNSESGELMAAKRVLVAPRNEDTDRLMGHLESEIEVMRSLRHENIVRYWGTARSDTELIIFMEYVPGGSIASLVHKFGRFEEPLVRVYTRQLLQGLEYLHRNRIVHRDIKGANILVDGSGVCKLSDFGAARRLEEIATSRSGPSSLRGTPYWMAPEVVRQSSTVGAPADIWSVGCTVIEMATGRPPWADVETPVAVLYRISMAKAGPVMPQALSPEGVDFLTKCFAADPLARPTAAELLRHAFLRPPAAGGERHGGPAAAAAVAADVPVSRGRLAVSPVGFLPGTAGGGGGARSGAHELLVHRVVQSPTADFWRDALDERAPAPVSDGGSPPSKLLTAAAGAGATSSTSGSSGLLGARSETKRSPIGFTLWTGKKTKVVQPAAAAVATAAAGAGEGPSSPLDAAVHAFVESAVTPPKASIRGVAADEGVAPAAGAVPLARRDSLADAEEATAYIGAQVEAYKAHLLRTDEALYAVRAGAVRAGRCIIVCHWSRFRLPQSFRALVEGRGPRIAVSGGVAAGMEAVGLPPPPLMTTAWQAGALLSGSDGGELSSVVSVGRRVSLLVTAAEATETMSDEFDVDGGGGVDSVVTRSGGHHGEHFGGGRGGGGGSGGGGGGGAPVVVDKVDYGGDDERPMRGRRHLAAEEAAVGGPARDRTDQDAEIKRGALGARPPALTVRLRAAAAIYSTPAGPAGRIERLRSNMLPRSPQPAPQLARAAEALAVEPERAPEVLATTPPDAAAASALRTPSSPRRRVESGGGAAAAATTAAFVAHAAGSPSVVAAGSASVALAVAAAASPGAAAASAAAAAAAPASARRGTARKNVFGFGSGRRSVGIAS